MGLYEAGTPGPGAGHRGGRRHGPVGVREGRRPGRCPEPARPGAGAGWPGIRGDRPLPRVSPPLSPSLCRPVFSRRRTAVREHPMRRYRPRVCLQRPAGLQAVERHESAGNLWPPTCVILSMKDLMATLGVRSGERAFTAATVAAVMLVLLAGPVSRAAGGTGFADVQEGGVHRPAIEALDGAGVLDGTECAPDSFCPADPIPRWVVAVWLVRVLDGGDPPGAGGSSFADVDGAEWWAPHVERLADLEVTTGCAADPLRFCPDDPVTRAQMASFLARAFDLASSSTAGFEDVPERGTHTGSIDALAEARITAGCSNDPLRFCPGDPVTRGQMATFLARAEGMVPLPNRVTPYRIGFTRQHLPVDRIFVMRSGGAGLWQVASEGSGRDPAWSPDGTRIAYTAAPSPGPDGDSQDTGPRVFVAGLYQWIDPRDLGAGHSPAWSPDGTRLAISGPDEGAPEILIADVDGTGRRALARGRGHAWSPDGLSIAFTRQVQGVDGVFVIGADGTGERYLGEGTGPVWSPDGERIAFTRDGVDGYDIFAINADGTEELQLTDAAGHDRRPTWSPEGDLIAFDTERHGDLTEESPHTEIYVMNADGSGQHRLTQGGGENRRPVWSPDGQRIAFTTEEWVYHYIYSMNADGSDRRIMTYTTDDRDPVWSPDGRFIAFTSDRPGNYLSLVTAADGTGQKQVADTGTGVPVWSPARTRLAFSCCEGYLGYISVVDADGRGYARRLAETAGTDWALDPVWSPNGARIAFTRSVRSDNEVGFVGELFLIGADGANVMQITLTDGGAYGSRSPVWSPDGSQVAYIRFRDLDPAPNVSNVDTELMVVRVDGSGQRQIADTRGDDYSPAWSPDGTRIAFVNSTQSRDTIFVVNADGTDQRSLAVSSGDQWTPEWSPDGTRISFTGWLRRGERPSVYVVNADGSDLKSLGFGALPEWSPDGSRIAFVDYGDTGSYGEIVSINPDGTDPRPLTRTGPDTVPAGLAWSPDGRRIAFSSSHDGDDEIYVVNADGTGQTQLTDNDFFADTNPVWISG
ncbi:MAG: hypothetical protein F4X18_06895 [Acidimicrobiia bacterium]|nr:hypothetical protein [Acidimicrobiia bacterium]